MSEKPLDPEEREKRRRRLAEVFGDVLPEQTSDDAAEPETAARRRRRVARSARCPRTTARLRAAQTWPPRVASRSRISSSSATSAGVPASSAGKYFSLATV